jgi:hypothetical protein
MPFHLSWGSSRYNLREAARPFAVEQTMVNIIFNQWLLQGVEHGTYLKTLEQHNGTGLLDDEATRLANRHGWSGDNTERRVEHECVFAFV